MVDGASYKLEVGGLIDNKAPWTLDKLYALPQVSQITRHVCVEGWSAIGSWQGVRLSEFLKRIGADTRAKYVWFQCAEGYSNTIDMPTALHPQTQLSFKFDNQMLPRKYGFPMKCRMPTKLGFKNPEVHHRDVRAEQRRRRLLGGQGLQLVQRAVTSERSGRFRPACTRPFTAMAGILAQIAKGRVAPALYSEAIAENYLRAALRRRRTTTSMRAIS